MRLAGLDLLRVVGVAAVVTGHVYTGPLTHQWGYPWHVPLFFFLTGYFWTAGRALSAEAAVRGRTLLLPYATWLIVNATVFTLLTGPSLPMMAAALWGGSRATGPFGAFWFITALFFTALLARLLERFPPVVAWIVAGIGLLVCWIAPGRLDDLPLGLGMAVPCLAFLVAGRLAHTSTPGGRRGRLLGVGLLLASAIAIAVLPVGEIDIKVALLGTPVLGVAVSIAICWGLVAVARDLPLSRPVARASTTLASVAVTVVLTHTVAIWYLRLEGVRSIVILAVALVGSWLLALVLRAAPGSRFTTGARSRPGTAAAPVAERHPDERPGEHPGSP